MKRLIVLAVLAAVCGVAAGQARTRTAAPPPKSGLRGDVEMQADSIDKLKDRVTALEKKLAALEKLVASATADPKAAARLGKEAAIEKAIAEGTLAVGMTLEQANRAMKDEGKLAGEDRGEQTYEWKIWGQRESSGAPGLSSGRFASGVGGRPSMHDYEKGFAQAVFVNGKIVRFEAHDF